MNSSVTLDSAISVISSLCLEIRPSSRSKGPSKTSRWTWNPPPTGAGSPASAGSPGSFVIMLVPCGSCRAHSRSRGYPNRSLPISQPPGHHAVLAGGLKVGEQDCQCLADDPAPVDGDAVGAQRQPGALQLD